jgi:hypothetical protein
VSITRRYTQRWPMDNHKPSHSSTAGVRVPPITTRSHDRPRALASPELEGGQAPTSCPGSRCANLELRFPNTFDYISHLACNLDKYIYRVCVTGVVHHSSHCSSEQRESSVFDSAAINQFNICKTRIVVVNLSDIPQATLQEYSDVVIDGPWKRRLKPRSPNPTYLPVCCY